MFSKIKKIFFNGVFGILYIAFIAQLVYLVWSLWGQRIGEEAYRFDSFGFLILQWLALIAARFLSKKSSSNANREYTGGHNNYRR